MNDEARAVSVGGDDIIETNAGRSLPKGPAARTRPRDIVGSGLGVATRPMFPTQSLRRMVGSTSLSALTRNPSKAIETLVIGIVLQWVKWWIAMFRLSFFANCISLEPTREATHKEFFSVIL